VDSRCISFLSLSLQDSNLSAPAFLTGDLFPSRRTNVRLLQPNLTGAAMPLVWVGGECEDFLDLCEKVFFLIQYRGGGLAPHRSNEASTVLELLRIASQVECLFFGCLFFSSCPPPPYFQSSNTN
jgi:hypothetical protein